MKYITKNLDFQLDKRSVVTLGKFDGVHKGHSKLINRVLEIGKEGYETVVLKKAARLPAASTLSVLPGRPVFL